MFGGQTLPLEHAPRPRHGIVRKRAHHRDAFSFND
jgi:hypothetical protein